MATSIDILEQIKGLLQEQNAKVEMPEVSPWAEAKSPDVAKPSQSSPRIEPPFRESGKSSPSAPEIQPPVMPRMANFEPPPERPRGASWMPWEKESPPPEIRQPAQQQPQPVSPAVQQRKNDLALMEGLGLKPQVSRAQSTPESIGSSSQAQGQSLNRQQQEMIQVLKEVLQALKDLKDEIAALKLPGMAQQPKEPGGFIPGGPRPLAGARTSSTAKRQGAARTNQGDD